MEFHHVSAAEIATEPLDVGADGKLSLVDVIDRTQGAPFCAGVCEVSPALPSTSTTTTTRRPATCSRGRSSSPRAARSGLQARRRGLHPPEEGAWWSTGVRRRTAGSSTSRTRTGDEPWQRNLSTTATCSTTRPMPSTSGPGTARQVRLHPGTEALARLLLHLRDRLQLHLGDQRLLRALLLRPGHRRPGRPHLAVAHHRVRPVHGRPRVRRGGFALSAGRRRVPVGQAVHGRHLRLVVAWLFAAALLVTVAAVAFGVAPIVCSLMGWDSSNSTTLLWIAVAFALGPMT